MAKVSVIVPFKVDTAKQVDWLIEAAKSVEAQTFKDWELMLVNDHSEADLTLFKTFLKTLPKEKVHGRTSPGYGVSVARNVGARQCHGDLLMPLDADDMLMPTSLEHMVDAWDHAGHEHGIVYGDTELFGQDWSQLLKGQPYDFNLLLQRLLMIVGSLHRKSDWDRVGGWKAKMEHGLEDWEYWIAMGEIGVCGYYIPTVTYRYRKHTEGRLAWLRKDEQRFTAAMQTMRDLHADVYKGRFPVGCCGKGSKVATVGSAARAIDPDRLLSADGRVDVKYYGKRRGSFFVTGRGTGMKYKVMGFGNSLIDTNMIAGVMPQDVAFICSLGRGSAFRAHTS